MDLARHQSFVLFSFVIFLSAFYSVKLTTFITLVVGKEGGLSNTTPTLGDCIPKCRREGFDEEWEEGRESR